MKDAETVTFGGSGLRREAEGRADIPALAAEPGARVVLSWHGKPLVQDAAQGPVLARLAPDHPALAQAGEAVFLGRDDDGPVLARSLEGWTPPDVDPARLDGYADPTRQRHPGLGAGQGFAELRSVMTQLSARDAELAATARALLGWHRSHGFCARCGAPTAIAAAGWQRHCRDCGARHFPRTDPVVIMLVTHGNSVLLGRSPAWPARMHSLLAGYVEPGETMEAAVRREVAEETAVPVGAVRYLASQPWPFPSSLMLGCHAEALGRQITLDPVELDAACWVSRERMAAIVAGEDAEIAPPRSGAIAGFLLHRWLADRLD